MTKPQTRLVRVPFAGFYGAWDQDIDHVEEMEAEYNFRERQEEDHVPPELQLSERDYADILMRHTQYSIAYRKIAHAYCDAFAYALKEELGLDVPLAFESLTSPREYNFETDRLWADIPLSAVRRLFALSKADGHAKLSAYLADHCTSRSGFISHYSNAVSVWLAKPVTDWDHNELCALLCAGIAIKGDAVDISARDFERRVEDIVRDGETIYSAWSDAVDWQAVDAAVAEARADMTAELQADAPEYEPPFRCPHTLDLFHWARERGLLA